MIIQAGDLELEAALWEPEGATPAAGSLLCHPHPLYGGTMNNRVVYHAARGVVEAGLAALRFNFRGVGSSTGSYSKGIGERQDVAVLLDWLKLRYADRPLGLVGFSFGAWVGLQVGCHDPRVKALIGLGLPLNTYDFEFLIDNPKPSLFIVGTNDEFCPRDKMEQLARRMPLTSGVMWVENSNHFFSHQIDEVQRLVREFCRAHFTGHPE